MSVVKVSRADALGLFTALGVNAAEKWNTNRLTAKINGIDKMVDDDVKLTGAADKTLTLALQAIVDEKKIEIITDAPDTTPAKPEKPVKAAKAAPPAPAKSVKAPAKATEPMTFEKLKAQYEAGKIDAKEFQAQRKALRADAKANAQPTPAPAKPVKPTQPKEGTPAKPVKVSKAAARTAAKAAEKAAAKEPKTKPEKPVKAAKAPKEPKPPKVPKVREIPTRRYYAGVLLKKYGIEGGVTPAMVAELDELYGVTNPRESEAILRNSHHLIRGYINGK